MAIVQENIMSQIANNIICPRKFHNAVSKLRHFFESRGYIEVHTQSRLSILAACEDPRTISTFDYAGEVWPLPQTGQMWLEYELLKNPDLAGVFCVSTSYRNEPNPIPGRHDLVFPMFEFESKGTMTDLYFLERDLIHELGIEDKYCITDKDYDEWAKEFGVEELEAEHETAMYDKYGPACMIKNFPQSTSPFWNMKKNGDHANKIDVILCGIETIGSAERSTDADEMRHLFHTISDGMYADILYARFGKDRVEKELEEFLTFDFFPRFGGGIGMTRMIRALELTA